MDSDTISMVALLTSLAIFSVVGNGLVIGILARFKKLRTFPNILLANLSLGNLLNSLINIPLFLLYGAVQLSSFTGKKLAMFVLYFSRLFSLLNLASMLVLLVNIFLALTFDLRYFTWKTNEKAMAIVLVEWFVCVVLTSSTALLHLEVDLENAHVLQYRQLFHRQDKYFLGPLMAMFMVCAVTVGVLVIYSSRRKKKWQVRFTVT